MHRESGLAYDQLPLELVKQIDTLARSAERAWRSGKEVPIEEYLAQVAPPGRAALLEELLWLEAEQLGRQGSARRVTEWLERFPDETAIVHRVVNEATSATSATSPSVSQNRFPHIAGYTIEKQLGRGATGVVYLARQDRLQRMVAVKVMAAGIELAQASTIIRAEAEVIARLRHPNIVQVFEVGEADGEPYLTLEYVPGPSLREWLLNHQLAYRQAAALIEQLARAIHHAHTHGVVHRDLKPANILLMPDEASSTASDHSNRSIPTPKITDFGLAKVLDVLQHQTRSGTVLGTPKYMAPEQAEGRGRDIGPETDVYALGVVLFEMLTGRPPFESASTLVLLKQISQSEAIFPSNTDSVPVDLQAICLRCLEKSPARRYPSALELAEDLRRYLQDFPVAARRPSRYDMAIKFMRRNRSLVASMVIVFVTLVVASIGIGVLAIREAQARRVAEQLAQDQSIARENLQALRKQDSHNVYWANLHSTQQAWQESRVETMQKHLQQAMPSQAGDEDLRGFEWHYLWRLSHPPTVVLQGHHASAIAFSHDGKWIASPSSAGEVRVFDSQSGELLFSLPGHHSIVDIAFSPDGQWLAVGSRDTRIHVWNLQTRKIAHVLQGHQHPVRTIAFSPDSQSLASGDEVNRAIMWDVDSGQSQWVFTLPNLYVMKLSFSHDGDVLALGRGGGRICLLEAKHGRELKSFLAHSVWLTGLAFSPIDNRLATCGGDRVVKIWDIKNPESPVELKGHSDWVTGVAFSSDGDSIASCSRDGTVRLWESQTGQPQVTLTGHSNWVMGVTFSGDGQRIASASIDGTARIWKPNQDWEARTLVSSTSNLTSLAYSMDGKQLLTGNALGEVAIHDVRSGQALLSLKAHQDVVSDLAVTIDGQRFITASQDDTIKVWSRADGQELLTLTGHTQAIRKIAVAPNGHELFSASTDGTVRVWNLETGHEVKRLELGTELLVLAVSSDGRFMAATGGNEVNVWDTTSWEKVKTYQGHTHVVSYVAFSASGDLLVSGGTDRTICLWDFKSDRLLQRMSGHTNIVTGLVFSENDRRVVSCGHDGTVRFWETSTGRELLTLRHHTDWITALRVSPTQRTIATTSNDHTSKLIELD